jgi:hypothetical protein
MKLSQLSKVLPLLSYRSIRRKACLLVVPFQSLSDSPSPISTMHCYRESTPSDKPYYYDVSHFGIIRAVCFALVTFLSPSLLYFNI